MADAVIYAVVVMPITNDAGRNIGGEHALRIHGGGHRRPDLLSGRRPGTGSSVFNEIITELRTQYLLGFYPKDVPLTKERFHKLEVRLKPPDLRVSARNGYYGEVGGRTRRYRPDRPHLRVRPNRQPKPPTEEAVRRIDYATTQENPLARRNRRLKSRSISNS